MTDWKNMDMERDGDACMIDAMTLDGFLTSIGSNIEDINTATVTKEFEEHLAAIVSDARYVFECNRDAIVAHALEMRKGD